MVSGLKRNEKQMLIFMSLQVAVIVAGVVVAVITGSFVLASWIMMIGTPTVIFGTLFYVVVFDSKKRWRGVGAGRRLVKVITFDNS